MSPALRASCGCGGLLVTAQKKQSACARPSMAASPRLLAGRREQPFYLSPGDRDNGGQVARPHWFSRCGTPLAPASAAVRLVVDRSADLNVFVRPGLGCLELIEFAAGESRAAD